MRFQGNPPLTYPSKKMHDTRTPRPAWIRISFESLDDDERKLADEPELCFPGSRALCVRSVVCSAESVRPRIILDAESCLGANV